jgi:glycosyltransferase involved in cell wall biosynthesis
MSDKAKPTVLVLATRVPLKSGDGNPSFVLDNATALADEFNITILAPRVKGSTIDTRSDGVTIRRFPYFPSRWERLADDAIMPQLAEDRTLWFQAIALVAMMFRYALLEHRIRRPDVVHANWVLPAGLVALIVRLTFGTPYLVTSHGADAFRSNSGLLRLLNRAILARASRLIGVSQDIINQFGALDIPVDVQPVGVHFSLWQNLVGTRSPERGRVLFVGRLTEKKGVHNALQAVAALDSAHLRIIGDGPLQDELERLASSLLAEERVFFLGRLSRAEIAQELRSASCIVIPSITSADGDRDGTPTVLGEAIAAKVPVVASRIAGLAEFIIDGETGLLFEPGDVRGLTRCLQALLDASADGALLARQASERYSVLFDQKVVARRYTAWYRAAIIDS